MATFHMFQACSLQGRYRPNYEFTKKCHSTRDAEFFLRAPFYSNGGKTTNSECFEILRKSLSADSRGKPCSIQAQAIRKSTGLPWVPFSRQWFLRRVAST